jgi:hypothetical protein
MTRASVLFAGLVILGAAAPSVCPLTAQALAGKSANALATAPDRSTPEATVRSFVAALSKGQVSRAASFVEGKPVSTPDLERRTVAGKGHYCYRLVPGGGAPVWANPAIRVQ